MNESARARVPRSIVTMVPNPPWSKRAALANSGCDGRPGIEDPVHAGMAFEPPRQIQCRPAGSVEPHAATWPGRAAPASFRTGCPSGPGSTPRLESAQSRLWPTTTPRVRSLWPPIILVAEWTTKLAPCSIGRQRSGAKVLSTTRGMPAFRATARQCGEIGDPEERVGNRLHVDQPGLRTHE